MLEQLKCAARPSHAPERITASPQAQIPISDSQQKRHVVSFGSFQLDPIQRRLTEHGKPLPLGGRAYDVLAALVARRGSIVSKRELKDCVWPGQIVEDNTLHAQISVLRRVCASSPDLLKTVAGRGYRLTAVVEEPDAASTSTLRAAPTASGHASALQPSNLPDSAFALIGRAREIDAVAGQLREHRLVCLLGPGGIGKSRLSLAVAHHLRPEFNGRVWIVDLAALSDGEQVLGAIATTLGLAHLGNATHADDGLGASPALLVLDNCEHVIDAASRAAEALLQANGALRLMVTSREALRAEGERVFHVPPLDVPDADLDSDAVGQYAAVRLFVDRVKAAGLDPSPDTRRHSLIGEICRRLEGNPLALELAALRAATIGVDELAQRLPDRLRLLTSGRRLAPPRHQSLAASLEWSYALLSERERTVLRRLAVFSGSFTLDSARAIAAGPGVSVPDVDECIMTLIAKSLMTADVGGTAALYRMCETTQLFAREKLARADHGSSGSESAAARSDELPPDRRDNVITRLTFGGPAKGAMLAGKLTMKPTEATLAVS